MQGAVPFSGVPVAGALISAVSADQRLARSTRMKWANDSARSFVKRARTRSK
jgi:hypothetical protein